MFDVLILICLASIIALLITMLWRKPQTPENSQLALNESLAQFESSLSSSMERTRFEVEQSKDILSQNAIQTISTIKDIGSTVHALIEQQKKAESLAESLHYLFQSPKLRGDFGETVLEEMLDKVLPRGIWKGQYCIDSNSNERVDAAIIYRDVTIPIDAKFPKEDYIRFSQAQDEKERAAAWKGYETALKTQINSIAAKYVKPELGTSQFALMFIPSETIYYETIAAKNFLGEPSALLEYAQEKNVLPVSPNNFYAFLQIVLMGVQNIEIERSAKTIQAKLCEIEKSFEQFFIKFEDIGKSLEKATLAYRGGYDHILKYKNSLEDAISIDFDKDEPEMANSLRE